MLATEITMLAIDVPLPATLSQALAHKQQGMQM